MEVQVRIHRDILAGLLACTTSARGRNPVYANIGVSSDGTKLYAADSTILAVGDCDGFSLIPGAVLSGTDLAQFARNHARTRLQWFTFELDWDNVDGKPRLLGLVPTQFGEGKFGIRILHDQQFPDPTGLIEGHPFGQGSSQFAVAASQLTRVAKVMKPLHTAFIVPGQNRSTSWWAIGRAMTTTKPAPELRLLVMPVHTSEWPE